MLAGLAETLAGPPVDTRSPLRVGRPAAVETRRRGEAHERCVVGGLVPELGLGRLGADDRTEPGRAQLSAQRSRAGAVALFALAEVALALDTSHRRAVGEHLGDVRPISGLLGQAEEHRDVTRPGLGDQLLDHRVIELDEVAVGSCRIE